MICKRKIQWFQVLLCITNNSIKHQSFVYTQLNNQTVLFQTIQFSMSFVCTQSICQSVLFDPWIRRYHSGTEWTWNRLQWRDTPHSLKLERYRSLTIRFFNVIARTLVVGGSSYPSAEMQSVYSTAPAD